MALYYPENLRSVPLGSLRTGAPLTFPWGGSSQHLRGVGSIGFTVYGHLLIRMGALSI